MIAELQVLPTPAGIRGNEFKHVDAAIAVIASSGLKHSVHALGTIIEGDSDAVWDVARRAFDACMASGAEKQLMNIKMYQGSHSVDDLEASGQAAAVGAAVPAALPKPKPKPSPKVPAQKSGKAATPPPREVLKEPQARKPPTPRDTAAPVPKRARVAVAKPATAAREAAPVDQESGELKRPRGAAPKGKKWDAQRGWVDLAPVDGRDGPTAGEDEAAGLEEEEENPEIEGAAVAAAAAAAALAAAEAESESEVEGAEGESSTVGMKRPRGAAPRGKMWDPMIGWVPVDA